jgi:hypothetical protein
LIGVSMRFSRVLPFLFALVAVENARADGICRSVEVVFNPVANLQIAVWFEDQSGNYVDTAFVTRLTGTLGLANRPGNHLFKSDFRYPYGRRDMVLPVWAHARNHPYGYVVMGGRAGNSIASCAAYGIAGSECDDDTIGYHFDVSSPEPFYCGPSGGVTSIVNGVDVVSCASSFYGSKGAFASAPAFSLYPPRADLTKFIDEHDGPDAHNFMGDNDLGAISGATPPGRALIDPPVRWTPPADGAYVAKIEVSLEGDVNAYNTHPPVDDKNLELNGYGKIKYFGQPSVVYAVPFTVGPGLDEQTAQSYAGYGDWDGATGTLHAPDMTITDMPGTGAGRLLDVTDGGATFRVRVRAIPNCIMVGPGDGGTPPDGAGMTCQPPGAPQQMSVVAHSNSIDVSFASAAGLPTSSFDVRYREGAPISDDDFITAIPSSLPAPAPGWPGSTVNTTITGLRPETQYYIGIRAVAACEAVSSVTTTVITTSKAKFVTLNGCFIATAAWGTPLAAELGVLRRFRDTRLTTNPLGRLAVAAYYSLSPPLAAAISTDERLRAGARRMVQPLVDVARAIERARR